jgi:hypothetical protein
MVHIMDIATEASSHITAEDGRKHLSLQCLHDCGAVRFIIHAALAAAFDKQTFKLQKLVLQSLCSPQHSPHTHNISCPTQEKRKSAATTMQQGAIPVGSYIIQTVHGGPKLTGGGRGVLHRKAESHELIVAERDEEDQRESQTFWIEPIPEFQYDEKETNLIYQITHIASGELVEVPNGSCTIGQPVKTWSQTGMNPQMWTFIKLDESKDGGYIFLSFLMNAQ